MKGKILECSINPASPKIQIDEALFLNLFDQVVPVNNIRIFGRDRVVQAFIEVLSEKDGQKAIQALHKKKLNIGKTKVYFSHKTNITFDRSLNESLRSKRQHVKALNMESRFKESSSNKSNSDEGNKTVVRQLSSWKNKEKQNEKKSKNQKNNIGYQTYKDYTNGKKQSLQSSFDSIDMSDSGFKSFGVIGKPIETNILQISPIDTNYVSCITLLNIFSNFGNVSEVAINIESRTAFLKFEYQQQVETCISYLNGVRLFGTKLTMSKSFKNKIFNSQLLNDKELFKYKKNKPKFFRFKEGQANMMNKPSNTILVSNLVPQMNAVVLCNLLSKIHEPRKLIKFSKKGSRKENYLIEFETVPEAIDVLALLHNKKINNQFLQIEFSQKRL